MINQLTYSINALQTSRVNKTTSLSVYQLCDRPGHGAKDCRKFKKNKVSKMLFVTTATNADIMLVIAGKTNIA